MSQPQAIQLFESVQVRSHWDEVQEKWYFSVVDVVQVLTESVNPTDYLKKLRKRDPELGSYLGTNCPDLPPINSNTAIQSPIPLERKLDDEEEIYRRADHWLPA